MKHYSHDYTKVSAAESHLYEAQKLIDAKLGAFGSYEAWRHIAHARRLLQEYLSEDNMVEDDDVDGWVKASEAEALII